MCKRLAVLSLICLGFLVLSAPVTAAGLAPAVADCERNGRLTQNYTTAQLQQALRTMPVDTREYSDCYTIINQALLAAIHNLRGGDSSGSGGSFLPVWLIVVLVLLVLGGAALGVMALRNRGEDPPDG